MNGLERPTRTESAPLTRDGRRSQVVLSLEGGYDLPAMCDCAQECVRALLGERPAAPAPHELARQPALPAQDVLRTTMAIQAHHWPSVGGARESWRFAEPSPQSVLVNGLRPLQFSNNSL